MNPQSVSQSRARLRARALMSSHVEARQHIKEISAGDSILPTTSPAQLVLEGRVWRALGYAHVESTVGLPHLVVSKLRPKTDRLEVHVEEQSADFIIERLTATDNLSISHDGGSRLTVQAPGGPAVMNFIGISNAPFKRPAIGGALLHASDGLLGLIMRRFGLIREIGASQIDGWAKKDTYLLELTFDADLPSTAAIGRALDALRSPSFAPRLDLQPSRDGYVITSPGMPGASIILRLNALEAKFGTAPALSEVTA